MSRHSVLQMICDRFSQRHSRRFCGFPSQPSGHLVGGARVASATRGAEAETATTAAEPPRSALLDYAAECVAAMVGCPGYRETSDGNRLASKRLPTLLALAIQAAGR